MKKLYFGLIVVLTVLIGAGTGLLLWTLRADETFVRKVELSAGGVTAETLSFTAENFLPGQTREYTVSLTSAESGEFSVSFSCGEEESGTLWRYIDVEIVCGEVSKEAPFAELFGGSALTFDVALQADAPARFTVRYKMPASVGNEAQRERADFLLLLTAERK